MKNWIPKLVTGDIIVRVANGNNHVITCVTDKEIYSKLIGGDERSYVHNRTILYSAYKLSAMTANRIKMRKALGV